jgi:hypothetical protein
MNYKTPNSGLHWQLGPKKNPQPTPPTPIFDKLVSPASPEANLDRGDKVEALEVTEKPVQLLLRRKHLYLTKVKHTYKLKKIIFHTQLVRNWNRQRGYPENRNLGPRPIKYSANLPDSVAKAEQPSKLPPVVKAPRNFPWNFHRAFPRPIRFPTNYQEPEYIFHPVPEPDPVPVEFVEVPVAVKTEEAEEVPTEFEEITPDYLVSFSGYFDV